MAVNRVFAPNGKLQNANCKLENAKCKLQIGNWKLEIGNWKLENGKWKMENPYCFLVFSIFRFFRTFFHKLTLKRANADRRKQDGKGARSACGNKSGNKAQRLTD